MPAEFPTVLKGLVREMLRQQPADLYAFGAEYFAAVQAKAAEPSAPTRLSAEQLKELLNATFKDADADSSGALSLAEFKTVLTSLDLGLNPKEVKQVMMEADFDGNGEISYEEFIPMAVDLVQTMYAKIEARAQRDADEQAAMEEAKHYLVHGMSKEQVEGVMMEIFNKSDADGSGALSITEFQKCCKDADIGLTRKEINLLMHSCDVDGDGQISYEEFVPLCFEMLTEILKEELLQEKQSPSELEAFLIDIFLKDATDDGLLDPQTLKDLIKRADLGLTRLQILSIVAEASYDEEDKVDCKKFAPLAASMIYKMLDMDSQIEKAEAVQALLSEGKSFDTIRGIQQNQIEATLNEEFSGLDASGTGLLRLAQVKQVMQSSKLQLTPGEIAALTSAADPDANGDVGYAALASYAFYILQYMAQQTAISA